MRTSRGTSGDHLNHFTEDVDVDIDVEVDGAGDVEVDGDGLGHHHKHNRSHFNLYVAVWDTDKDLVRKPPNRHN